MTKSFSAGLLFLLFAGCAAVAPRVEEVADPFLQIAGAQGFASAPVSAREPSILREASLPHKGVALKSIVLLAENDRVAAVFWTATFDAESDLRSVKRFLFVRLSRQTRDFTDDVFKMEDGSLFPFLSFFDPAFHEEKIIIVAAGEVLYEFHVMTEHEESVWGLIQTLAPSPEFSRLPHQ